MVEYVRRELVGLLGLRGCRFEYGTLMGGLPRLVAVALAAQAGTALDAAGLSHQG
ncbi:hypothetical protein ACFRJ1_22400 [Streptomyces sp. NPDC056773]|uniref:hypothetical protein n=1 Tax=unclassified Streptomyces TaxID=2593676 RepID=UPI00369CC601